MQSGLAHVKIRVTYAKNKDREWHLVASGSDWIFEWEHTGISNYMETSPTKRAGGEYVDAWDCRIGKVDASEIRQRFEQVKTPQDALNFLNETGCVWGPGVLRFSDVNRLQAFFREAAQRSVPEWRFLSTYYPEEWMFDLQCPPLISLRSTTTSTYLEIDLNQMEGGSLQYAVGALLQVEKIKQIGLVRCRNRECHRSLYEYRADAEYCCSNCCNVVNNRKSKTASLEKKLAQCNDMTSRRRLFRRLLIQYEKLYGAEHPTVIDARLRWANEFIAYAERLRGSGKWEACKAVIFEVGEGLRSSALELLSIGVVQISYALYERAFEIYSATFGTNNLFTRELGYEIEEYFDLHRPLP